MPKDKTKYFCDEWLTDPKFTLWLEKVKNDNSHCKCVPCNKILKCGRSELTRHASRQTHCDNMNKINNKNKQEKIDNMYSTFNAELEKKQRFQENVKKLEMSLSAFFAEHNVAIHIVDHLIDLLKKNITDSSIVQNLQLKRTKCTAIINNVLAQKETDELISDLQKTKFSVLLDESTDISTCKQLCLIVRYIKDSGEVRSRLLQLVELDATDLTSIKIYEKFKEVFEGFAIPLSNVVGVACDGASVMVGKVNSFIAHFKKDYPNVILLKCICHSAHLVASKACLKLPNDAENLMRLIYSYVSASSKRCAHLREIQTQFNVQHYKILKLSGTRWLSMYQCVERILFNWNPLLAYFQIAVFEDNLDSAVTILQLMENPSTKAYLLFLKYILEYINKFNALFQSEKILINCLSSRSKLLIQQVGQNFLHGYLFKTDKKIDTNILRQGNYLELNQIFTGSECNEYISLKLNASDQYHVRTNILSFYITMLQEMIDRLPLGDVFSQFAFLSTEHVFNKNRIIFTDLTCLVDTFNDIDKHKINDEWRNLAFTFSSNEVDNLSNLPLDIMWSNIRNHKDYSGNYLFKNIGDLAQRVLSLPHANADCERLFSIVVDVKTKKRNRISENTLNSICVIRSSFQCKNIDCRNFVPDTVHYRLFREDIYTKKD